MSMLTRRFLIGSVFALALVGPAGFAHADVAEDPPSATITSPEDGSTFEGAPVTIDVTLDVFVGDIGFDRVELRIDGATSGSLTEEPWTFTGVTLEEGMHSLVAVAITPGGDEYPSSPVNVAVFAAADESEGSAGGDDEAKGCSINPGTGVGGGIILTGLLLFGLAGVRGRRQ